MSAHHQHPQYLRNARIVRARVRADHKVGRLVICIGCGRAITPEQAFDVGHIIDAARGGSHDLTNLGPQHRRENRQSGGRAGALIVNRTSRRAKGLPSW